MENSRMPESRTSGTAANESKSNSMSKDTKSSETNAPNSAQRPATAEGSKTGTDASKNSASTSTKSNTTTTGNAATSATVAPPAEKRTQIVSAIKSEKVEEVTNVNFSVTVGTRVPASVHFYPLPARVVEIYPEWRGYDFILVKGEYIIIKPGTHEIVYILEV
jgi:hypothetical protein